MATDRVAECKAHFHISQQNLRPIFTSLNGDNSWLLSFPRPITERKSTAKAYFHIVHDPWLNGPETQWSSWIVHLSLSSTPAVSNGTGVEGLVLEIEKAAADAGIISAQARKMEGESPIDAIFVNFHYGDHLHASTLLTFNPRIPIFATSQGAPVIKKLNHFDTIVTYRDLSPETFLGNWTSLHPSRLLPAYLTLFRICGHHELNFLSALIWSPTPDTHEVILYSPHGLYTSTPALQTLLHHSTPKFSTLALLHGLKESWTFNWQTTFGVASGLELYRESGAKYWINTHNDRLRYAGLVWWLVNDIFRTVEWGLGQEKGKEEEAVDVKEVRNGGCLVLD